MGQMKNYKQLVKELPSKKVVFAFGRFNPPTTGHELLVKMVKKIASTHDADHVIYASKTQDSKKNPLTVDKKVHYLNLMFQGTNFVGADAEIKTVVDVVKHLNKKYKNIIMIAGSDRVEDFSKILNKYNGSEFNYDTIEVVSAGERDPDADDASGMSGTKMRSFASKGDFAGFKRGLPSTIRELDGRRLMNDIRQGMGLDPIKEELNLVKDETRDKYFRGTIFNVDDIVESAGDVYKIVKRGSNHLLLQAEEGKLVSKWIQDVTTTERKFMLKEDLTNKTIKSTDKIKVARIISTMLGNDNAEGTSNPELLVNTALRRVKNKSLNSQGLDVLNKMLALATEVGIEYDTSLVPHKLKEEGPTVLPFNKKKDNNIAGDIAQADDVNKINKPGHSLAATSDTHRKMKVKHVTEGKTALDKWRAGADERLKKQKEDEDAYHAKKKNFETEFKKWQKEVHGDKLKEENLDELSNDLLTRYKKKAGADASAADKEGDTKRADKRFSGIIKATKKQFANDVKKEEVDLQEDRNELGALTPAERAAELKRRKQKIAGNTTPATKKFMDRALKSVSEENDLEESTPVAPVPGDKWKEHAVVVNGKQRVVIKRKHIDTYKKDGWKEVAPGMKEETEIEFCGTCGMSSCGCDHATQTEQNLEDQLMAELDLTDEQIDHIIDSTQEDDFIDAYEEDELAVVDDETGEEIEDDQEVNEEALMEVLSRAQRMRAKVRFAKTKSKRERRAVIAARTHASTKTVNKRARRLAIKLMKKRLLRGRDLNKLSVGEKERIERVIQRKKDVIGRVAMKLTPRVRAIEKARLSHSKFTKGSANVAF